jgi:hypothetical protein
VFSALSFVLEDCISVGKEIVYEKTARNPTENEL